MHRAGKSFKKSLHAEEQDRSDVACKRAFWTRHQHKIFPQRLIFVDETWKSIGTLLDAFTPKECANYLFSSGYVSM